MSIKAKIIAAAVCSLVAATISVSGYWAYNFLNKNFYQAISQSGEIISLQESISAGMIDIEGFYSVLENLKKKKSGYTDIQSIKNPF